MRNFMKYNLFDFSQNASTDGIQSHHSNLCGHSETVRTTTGCFLSHVRGDIRWVCSVWQSPIWKND